MQSAVFITDGHWRKTLAAVRALGRTGADVTVGESTRLATAAFSRYCRHVVVYPSPLTRPGAFVSHLERSLARRPYRMLLPMEDETLDIVTRHREVFDRHTFIPAVANATLRLARRKDKILSLAAALGIPTPRTWQVETLEQLDVLKDRLPYPVVIKPRQGAGAEGVAYPRDAAEFVQTYRRTHRTHPFPLVQERIPAEGPGYGASFLMDAGGRVKAAFVHRRLREYPVSGGASTLRESVRYDAVREMGETLLKALNWFGVAMVEFKLDPRDNTPKLMEINPRFWGSLALAVAAGVNFPHLLLRLARGEDFRPVETYQLGKRCRWMLPGDLLHFLHNPQRSRLQPSFFDFRDTTFDILSVQDPLPTVARLLTPLTFVYDPDMRLRLRKRKR